VQERRSHGSAGVGLSVADRDPADESVFSAHSATAGHGYRHLSSATGLRPPRLTNPDELTGDPPEHRLLREHRGGTRARRCPVWAPGRSRKAPARRHRRGPPGPRPAAGSTGARARSAPPAAVVPPPRKISVYVMRMARVNITVPDDLLERSRAAGLNVSRTAAQALAEELDRRAKIAELDRYLQELHAELGPLSDDEREAARKWADRVLPKPAARGETRSA
jgi:post-segregation antitoxin (ccd killing protein)